MSIFVEFEKKNPKNVLQFELGEYLVCAYQFENKVKVVLSKVKAIN